MGKTKPTFIDTNRIVMLWFGSLHTDNLLRSRDFITVENSSHEWASEGWSTVVGGRHGSSTIYERVLHRTKGPLHVEMVSKEESSMLTSVILCDNTE